MAGHWSPLHISNSLTASLAGPEFLLFSPAGPPVAQCDFFASLALQAHSTEAYSKLGISQASKLTPSLDDLSSFLIVKIKPSPPQFSSLPLSASLHSATAMEALSPVFQGKPPTSIFPSIYLLFSPQDFPALSLQGHGPALESSPDQADSLPCTWSLDCSSHPCQIQHVSGLVVWLVG